MTKKDVKYILLALSLSILICNFCITNFFSDDRGIDIIISLKNDRYFQAQVFYSEEKLGIFDGNYAVIKGIRKNNDYQNITIYLQIDKLEKLRLDFGSNPNNIWIQNLIIKGTKIINITPEQLKSYQQNQIDSSNLETEDKKTSFHLKSLKPDPFIIFPDEVVENTAYIRHNQMYLIAFRLFVFFLLIAIIYGVKNTCYRRNKIKEDIENDKNLIKNMKNNFSSKIMPIADFTGGYPLIAKLIDKKFYLPKILKFICTCFILLYLLAFIMKDHANNETSRVICKEFVNGPRNVIALIVNKFTNKQMKYRT